MRILKPIEYIDCPKCVGKNFSLPVTGRHGNLDCQTCDGESVIRKDENKVLRTVMNDSEKKWLGT